MRLLQACVCTHNPRLAVLRKVLASIARQTLQPPGFELVLIDNASDPPITDADCREVLGPVPFRIERERELGIAAARLRSVSATDAEWVVFVDDDNELAPDYFECAVRVIAENPRLGCFGGKLFLPHDIVVAPWIRPLLGFLAIRDAGDTPSTACSKDWGIWEPPAAGAIVRRPLLEHYRAALLNAAFEANGLGRKGERSFGACEDTLLMSGAHDLGLTASYQPSLRLIHHIDPSRLKFGYLMRLMYGHGNSRIRLERMLRDTGRRPRNDARRGALARTGRALSLTFIRDPAVSLRYACCMAAYRAGSAAARLATRDPAVAADDDEDFALRDPGA